MGRVDWFRRTTWTSRDRAEFYARLDRSRSVFHKAQYIRIQALHLQETSERELVTEAIVLLDDLVARFPYPGELASAQLQRAECLDLLDRPAEAIEGFRAAVVAQRASPGLVTRVAQAFGMFCIRRDLGGLLAEAARHVEELAPDSPFPRDVFEANSIMAFAAAHRGDATAARAFARGALDAAQATASGFWRYPTLGLVDAVEPTLRARLEDLAR